MNKKVLVLKGDSYQDVGEMFTAHGYDVLYDTEKLSQADLVVFTGGSDVSPYIYGEEPDGARGCDPIRDEFEKSIFHYCVSSESKYVPMVGICRGGQLLNVLNGGKMIQHLGETISGDVRVTCVGDDVDDFIDVFMRVDHHQGMIVKDCSDVFAWNENHFEWPDYAIFYPETKSLCFQPHPEWGHKGTEDYFFELLDKHVFPEGSEKEDA